MGCCYASEKKKKDREGGKGGYKPYIALAQMPNLHQTSDVVVIFSLFHYFQQKYKLHNMKQNLK